MSYTHLGQSSAYADQYDASLLQPIARGLQRVQLGLKAEQLPFLGADLWTGYELSWLNAKGKPQLALLQLTIPCDTPFLIESKSLKLYLNSFNQTVFADTAEVRETMARDLSAAAYGYQNGQQGLRQQPRIGVSVLPPELFDQQSIAELSGLDLDRLDIECRAYQPQPDLLQAAQGQAPVSEVLTSRLLKSNCLVTGQPDWGSVQIAYTGAPIDQAGLLAYIVSFRQHQEFHEHCVERIFCDIMARCQPTQLTVYARYTRRGGLDINPYRTTRAQALPANIRTARQ
jgi:7-cyano-7-deazaguanine reductase